MYGIVCFFVLSGVGYLVASNKSLTVNVFRSHDEHETCNTLIRLERVFLPFFNQARTKFNSIPFVSFHFKISIFFSHGRVE